MYGFSIGYIWEQSILHVFSKIGSFPYIANRETIHVQCRFLLNKDGYILGLVRSYDFKIGLKIG